MPKIYCSSCGGPTEYGLTKPKFCSQCGGSFQINATIKAEPKPQSFQRPPQRPRYEPEYEDDEPENFSGKVTNLTKFEVEIVAQTPVPQKLNDVWGSGPTGFSRDVKSGRKANPKQRLKQFRQNLAEKTVIDIGGNE
jgi:hypothetical protein